MASNLTTSEAGKALIRKHEGKRLIAYPDVANPNLWTIGYGHTGPDVHKGLRITSETAARLLAEDLEKHEREVRRLCDGVRTPQAAFDALVSFDFNTGRLHNSTLLVKHRAGLHSEAVREFHRWKYANGKVYRGLVARRADEAALYASAFA